MRPATRDLLVAGGVLVAAALFGFLGAPALVDEWSLWIVQGVLALSLMLVWGHGGIFSLGQAAFYGVGGYAAGVVAVNLGSGSVLALPGGLVAGAVVGAALAALLGYFMFYGRVTNIHVAIITLASTLLLFAVFNNTADPKWGIGDAKLGGFNGLVGIPPPRLGGLVLTQHGFFAMVVVVATAAGLGVRWLLRRPFGRITAGIRSNELRAELLGYDVRAYRFALFTIGGAIAGVGGALYASWGRFMSPTIFSLKPAALVIIWVLVGSRASVAGAFLGVFVVEGLTSWLGGSQGQYAPIYLGLALIAVVFVMPDGLVVTVTRAAARLRRAAPEPTADEPLELRLGDWAATEPVHSAPADGDPAMQAVDVAKHFGALKAVDGLSLDFAPRDVRCLVGPNGAGKSTLFSILTGRQAPTSGRVLLRGTDVTRLGPHQRARLGVGIKLQVACLFPDLGTEENLWLAAYACRSSPGPANVRAGEILKGLGLTSDAERRAGSLSHGQQQWLEIGMVLATEPSVLLLDEPTAGMSATETATTAELVRVLAQHASVVVIEHDMNFVRRLDAPITVLHLGRVLVHGSLAEIERDDRVLDIYLGQHHAAM